MSITSVSAVEGTATLLSVTHYAEPSDKAATQAPQAQGRSGTQTGQTLDDPVPPAIVDLMIHQQLSNGSSFAP